VLQEKGHYFMYMLPLVVADAVAAAATLSSALVSGVCVHSSMLQLLSLA
jgi:hypothetical protein